jgi:hypothetical protein
MKFLIYLASRDDVAYRNYVTLTETRPNESTYVKITTLDFNIDHKTFISKENKFEPLRLEDKANASVDFVAHGTSNTGNTLLIIPDHRYKSGVRDVYTDVKPSSIAEFFMRAASDEGQLKFETLNLICCESKNFGLELSRLLRDINVVCYDKDIYIKKIDPNSGIPHYINAAKEGVPAPKIIFKNGIDITPAPAALAVEQVDNNPPAEMLLRYKAKIEEANRPRSKSVNDSPAASPLLIPSRSQYPASNSHSRLEKIPVSEQQHPESEKEVSSVKRKSI